MNRVLLLLVLALLHGIGRAEAGPTRVLVVRTGQEPTCLDPGGLASAISRHSAFPSQIVVDGAARLDGVVEVRVARDAARIAVQITGDGHDLKRTLESAPCEAMADVVAAFVASVLAPAPDLPALDPVAPGSSSSPEQVDQVTEEAQTRIERGVLLADVLADDPELSRSHLTTGHLVIAGLAVAVGALTYARIEEGFGPGRVLTAGGALVAAAGGVIAASWSGEHAETVGELSYAIGFGALLGGQAFVGEEVVADSLVVQRDTFHEADLVVGATVALTGVWAALDRTRRRPTRRALADIRRRLATPEQRATLTRADLASYERTLRSSRPPRWRYMLPVVAGAATSFVLAARETNSAESDRGIRAGILLSSVAVVQTLIALIPDSATRYDRRLRNAGLDLSIAPLPAGAALSMRGGF